MEKNPEHRKRPKKKEGKPEGGFSQLQILLHIAKMYFSKLKLPKLNSKRYSKGTLKILE